MDARLVLSMESELPLLGSSTAGMAPIAIGYRGRRASISVGPYYGRQTRALSVVNYGSGSTFSTGVVDATASQYGVSVGGELVLVETHDRRTALHGGVGGTLAGTTNSFDAKASNSGLGATPWGTEGLSGEVTFGASARMGLRHWLTPHLAFGVEIGESYLSVPMGAIPLVTTASDGTTSVQGTRKVRSTSLGTFGTLGVSLVL